MFDIVNQLGNDPAGSALKFDVYRTNTERKRGRDRDRARRPKAEFIGRNLHTGQSGWQHGAFVKKRERDTGRTTAVETARGGRE